MMTIKPFVPIDKQIEILKKRGLFIDDKQIDIAHQFLLNNNYYRISGYSLTLRQNNQFFKNATLGTLMQIYEADRRMRHIILSISEVIEVRIKSMVSHFHSEKYGPLGYQDINNLNYTSSNPTYLQIKTKAESQKYNLKESELFIKHHMEHKNDILPFWVYVEVLTLSDISKLYTLLDEDLQKKVANLLGFKSNNNYEILKNLLHCIAILRNICAHGGRLYNRLFVRKPWLSKKEKHLLRKENGHTVYDKLFSYLLVLKSMTPPQEFQLAREHITLVQNQYPLVDLRHYGFPDNWQEIL